jgi:trans-aconitate 2-methyltransferase
MTEWNAADYERISQLQLTMADEVLAMLDLGGAHRILDVGCGNGKITAEIASRVPHATVLGVDPSHEMIEFASGHYDRAAYPNLRFEIADARSLPYRAEFDVVVSFNALHWVPQQEEALRSICAAMKPGARAQLRLVCKGERRSLEHVLEKTCTSPRWAQYFEQFHKPYVHLTPEAYCELAQHNGLQVVHVQYEDKAWDFKTRSAFEAFGFVTFVEWTRLLPAKEEPNFVGDVLDRYRLVASQTSGEENTFKFYQMDIGLRR